MKKSLDNAEILPRKLVNESMVCSALEEGREVIPDRTHICIGTKRTRRPAKVTPRVARRLLECNA